MFADISIVESAAPAAVAAVIGLAGSTFAWLMADSRSKGRADSMSQTVNEQKVKVEALSIAQAKSEQDRDGIHKTMDTKASREAVDGIRNELTQFRAEMVSGFNRIERTIEQHRDDINRDIRRQS